MVALDFFGERATHQRPCFVNRNTIDDRIRPRQINVLKNAWVQAGVFGALTAEKIARGVYQNRLARRHIAHDFKIQRIKRHTFGCHHKLNPVVGSTFTDYQRANTVRIAKREQAITRDHCHDRISTACAPMYPGDRCENGVRIKPLALG